MQFITKSILKEIYKKRKRWCHKYDFGNLLVIGGSKLYSGSPAFNALAAYRAGVDLVTIIAPERAANIIATFSPDLITYPVKGEYFEEKHLKEVFDVISTSQFNACVIGGGLGRNKKTRKFVIKFLQEIEIPCVIDADAIYAISEKKDVLKLVKRTKEDPIYEISNAIAERDVFKALFFNNSLIVLTFSIIPILFSHR